MNAVPADLVDKALGHADDDPNNVIHLWDKSRARSGKTDRARADGKFGVGPSDLSACQKAVEFRERPPEGHEPVDVPKSAAIIGTLIHDAATAARSAMYPWRQFGVPVHVPGLDVPGEADEVDPIIGRVTDYKTASSYKWEKVGVSGPPDGEWEQVLTYAFGLIDAGYTIEEVELLYVNRETGEWESHKRRYDQTAALAAVGRLHALLDALDAGDPLPRRRGDTDLLGPTVDTLCARYCPHVKACWNLDEVPEGRTPEGFLLVQADDDGAIANTLAVYDEARTAETEAGRAKEYARTLLQGLEPGTYGPYTLNWTGGKPSTKPDPKARVTQLEDAMRFAIATGEVPPDPDELPYPTTTTTRAKSISVKPVRKAKR